MNSLKHGKQIVRVILFIAVILIAVNLFCNKQNYLLAEKAYAERIKTTIKVGYIAGMPPFQFVKEGGEENSPQGLHIDLLEAIAADYNYKLEYVPFVEKDGIADALMNHTVDVVIGVQRVSKIEKYGLITDIISGSHLTIVTSEENLEEDKFLSFAPILTSAETGIVDYNLVIAMGHVSFLMCSTQEEAFQSLISGKTDSLIGVKDCITYQLEQIGKTNDYEIVKNYIAPTNFYMAVPKGDKELYNNLNTGLRSLRLDGTYSAIHDKWIPDESGQTRKLLKCIVYILLLAVAAIGIIFIINVRVNHLLKMKVAEQTKKIRISNEVRNKVVDQSPSAIILINLDGTVALFNKQAEVLMNYSADRAISNHVMEIPFVHDVFQSKLDSLTGNGPEYIANEIQVPDQWLEEHTYRYDIYKIEDDNNLPQGAILAVDDITEEIRERGESAEREKNAVLNQMIAEIAHEVLNPLTSIQAITDLLQQKKGNPEFYKIFAEVVPKELCRITVLMKNLLDYAKPSKTEKMYVKLAEAVDSCIQLVKPKIKHDKIIIENRCQDGIAVFLDENQLKQILINIMINSIESMKIKAGNCTELSALRLVINTWTSDDSAYIQVIDEGEGMTEEQIRLVAKPFYTTKANGTGLGLAISQRLVSENRGTMRIESQKNLGTTITLRFSTKE